MPDYIIDLPKLGELVVHLVNARRNDPYFSDAKLTSLFFLIDEEYYQKCAPPLSDEMFTPGYVDTTPTITGLRYTHHDFGPHPENWPAVRRYLGEAGFIYVWEEEMQGKQLKRDFPVFTRRPTVINLLTPEEFATVKNVCARHLSDNLAGVHQTTRYSGAWALAEAGEIIEFQNSWIRLDPLSIAQREAPFRRSP